VYAVKIVQDALFKPRYSCAKEADAAGDSKIAKSVQYGTV